MLGQDGVLQAEVHKADPPVARGSRTELLVAECRDLQCGSQTALEGVRLPSGSKGQVLTALGAPFQSDSGSPREPAGLDSPSLQAVGPNFSFVAAEIQKDTPEV